MRVDLLALAMGAGSFSAASASSDEGGVISGDIVERASGKRRVRNSCEDCRYVFEMWLGVGRVNVDDDKELIELDKTC